MRWATEAVAEAAAVTVEHLLEIHWRLLAGTRLEHVGGQVRVEQNWIGGSNRGFEATDLIHAFTALERRLASPDADTRVSPRRAVCPPGGADPGPCGSDSSSPS